MWNKIKLWLETKVKSKDQYSYKNKAIGPGLKKEDIPNPYGEYKPDAFSLSKTLKNQRDSEINP